MASEPDPRTPRTTAGMLAGHLDWQRGDLVAGVLALAPSQQRRSTVSSGWTPLELLSHALHMEQRWIVWGFLAEPVPRPWGDWDVDDPGAGDTGRWHVPDDVTAEELAARLEAVARRTRAVLRDHPLDARAALGGRFEADPPTLEWICFHVLGEHARHAGHLDVVVEQLGGSD